MIMHKISAIEFNCIHNEHMAEYYKLLVGKEPSTLKNEKGFEKHHIIPRCFGGPNDKTNIVKLTAYEHILAHYYLALGTNNVHMFHAFNCMLGKQFHKLQDIERLKLEELQHWAQLREQSRQRMFSDEGRATISRKAEERWSKFRESGRIEEVKKNISRTTAEGMAQSKTSQIRTRVNLGCKKYWNPETGECRNWYPGMPEFGEPWIRGRRPMSPEAKSKLSNTLRTSKKHWYHNDELRQNCSFNETDTIPNGWVLGMKKEYYGNRTTARQAQRYKTLEEIKAI